MVNLRPQHTITHDSCVSLHIIQIRGLPRTDTRHPGRMTRSIPLDPSDPPDPPDLPNPPNPSQQGERPPRARRVAGHLLLGGVVGAAIAIGTLASGLANTPSAEAMQSTEKTARWLPPLYSPFTVTGPYVPPPHPYASGHRGIDLRTGPGAAVGAPSDGTVTFVGNVAGRGVISVRVDERTVVSIEPVVSELGEGDGVRAGDAIGTVGAGGHCVGADGAVECIHLGVRVDEAYVNPLRYFFGRPRLLPW